MKRVASLYLPDWSIDRLRRIERRHAPPAEADRRAAPVEMGAGLVADIGAEAAAERARQCSVPRGGGWRPGARWARTDPVSCGGSGLADSRKAAAAAVEALPPHQRPPQRELGRASIAADNPFCGSADGSGSAPLRELSRRSEATGHPFRPMPSDEVRTTRDDYRNKAPQGPLLLHRSPGENRTAPGDHGRRKPPAPTSTPCPPAEPPLVTTRKVGPRVAIAAVNPAGRALGLAPGMALTMARAQAPGLEVRAADPQGDAADLRALAERLARRWSPIVAISDSDGSDAGGLFIDLTGVSHLHGGEARFARRILRLLARHGVTARLAVADTAGAAWALARWVAGGSTLIIEPGGHAAAIMPLPVAALRLDPASLELLARLGVDSVGQLLAMPRAPLVRRFGPAIAQRLDQATGRAPEPLDPVVPPTRIVAGQRFAEPIATAEAIEYWLRVLMPRLTRMLAEAGQGARAVELVAARIDGVPQRLRLGFARPTRDAAHMLRLALRRIEEIEPGYGIDEIALHVRRADPLGPEPLCSPLARAEPHQPAPPPGLPTKVYALGGRVGERAGAALPRENATALIEDLATLIDTLANRIGLGRLWRVTPVESDVPERSLAPASPIDPSTQPARALKADDVRRLDERTPDHPWHPRWPRPVRLLRHPEQVDHVLAELPDQPPRRFTWRGTTHRVVRAEGPERIAGEWWRRAGERQAVRDYFRVEDEAGERFWLYRRGDGVRAETGDLRWFLHGRGG